MSVLSAATTNGPGLTQDLLLPLVALAYWVPYWRRCRTLAARSQPVPAWRQCSFVVGLVLVVVGLSSPIGGLAQRTLAAHMVEHLMIGDLGALFLVLGLTGPLLVPLLRIGWVSRMRFLVNPAVAAPLWMIDFYLWHLPVLYQAALRHDAVHALQHVCFLFFGMTMWMALLGPLPKPAWFGNAARLLYIAAVRLAGGLLANILIWSHTVFYPYYEGRTGAYGLTALQDQGLAGAIMMIEGSALTFGLFAWVFWRAAAESDAKQELLDYARAHSLELDDERAGRAVRAGRGAELRERLEAAAAEPAPFARMSEDAPHHG